MRIKSLFFLPTAKRIILPSIKRSRVITAFSSTTFSLFMETPPFLISLRASPLLGCNPTFTISSINLLSTTSASGSDLLGISLAMLSRVSAFNTVLLPGAAASVVRSAFCNPSSPCTIRVTSSARRFLCDIWSR